ncbi:MAG: ribonuclease H-like domain-containing protein [Butyrivibrio sp.]|uniref:ribonuclease H-like domain-containing protein n=1 Tax=Butyrivibrio sp. TaxID=28121 RepID=UPI0025BD35E0|nr:ribonuclease H-like domain-containing protein [Butyrivibrio sp.]MBQ6588440.1 ribonuclease H-like domain-containing protein [Butyrivibrio sp.]
MIKTTEEFKLPDDHIAESLHIALGCRPDEILFIDIETTGLSPKTADLYLIGVSYRQGNTWHIVQFMSESIDHEKEILINFQTLLKDFKYVVHFNGNRFDIPFLQEKFSKYGLNDAFENVESFDLYKKISPYKLQLGLPDCKQKTIELYLGIDREDKYDGGKLIPVYKEFVEDKDPEKLRLLLLHNFEDVKGMFELLPMMRYLEFFNLFKNMPKVSIRTDEEIDDNAYDYELPVRARKVQANYYKDLDGTQKQEVYMKLSLPFELPSSLSGNLDNCYFKIVGSEATLRVPLYEQELKYYYSNYKDYYYLPKEDMAIHKSIAEFVDKAYREKATPENCYTKKAGQYLLEWDLVFAPFFKEDYKDKRFFFDLNENLKKSRFAMSLYASHVIAHILEG